MLYFLQIVALFHRYWMFTWLVLTALKYICFLQMKYLTWRWSLRFMKLFTANKMPGCRRGWLPTGPSVQVKLLSECQRRFWLSGIAWCFIILALCWISAAGREGGSCVPVWDAQLWFLLSIPGMCLCRQLDRSFPSADSGSLRCAENDAYTAFFAAVGRSGFISQERQGGFPAGRMFHCCPVLLVCWGQWVSPVTSRGPSVGLWAGDVLLFCPFCPCSEHLIE